MKNKWVRKLAAGMAVAMSLTLIGCGSDTKKEETDDKKTETSGDEKTESSGKKLTVGIWGGNDQEAAALDKMKADFEAKTGSELEFKIYTEYNTQIQADFIAGTAPDAFYIDASVFPFYSELGVMEPLDAKEMGSENYYSNLLDAFTAEDGTIYCIPKDTATLATYYNIGMLDSVGVKPEDIPDSLEEYKDFLADLQGKLDEKYGEGQVAAMTYNPELPRQLSLLEADGGSVIDADGNSNLSDEKVLKNLDFLIDLVTGGKMKTPQDLGLGWNGEAFGTEKVAIMEEGNWVYGTLKNDYSDIEFGVKGMPTYNDKAYSMLFTVGWGVSAISKEKDLAKEWIKYATGTEGMETWCKIAGTLPSRADVAKAIDVESDPVWKTHTEMIEVAVPWQKGTTIDIINNAYKNFVPKAFKGEESAKDAMEKTDKQANSEIKNAQ